MKFRFIVFGKKYDLRTAVGRFGWRKMYVYFRLRKIISTHYLEIRNEFSQMMDAAEIPGKGLKMEADFWLSWFSTGAVPEDYFDMMFFRKNREWKNHHVTRHRLLFIVPLFNSEETSKYLDNKALFNTHWSGYLNRKWCEPQNVTFEEFADTFGQCKSIIVKDLDGLGGKGVRTYSVEKDSLHSIYEELKKSSRKQIVEEYVFQKGFFHDLNPGSVNTIRITTMRIRDEVRVLFAYLRTGCGDSVVDNMHAGGIVFEIDRKTGTLQTGHTFSKFDIVIHPYSKIKIAGHVISRWKEIIAFVTGAHLHAPAGSYLIGWDVCVSDDGLSLIEGNSNPGFPRLPDPDEDMWEEVREYLDLTNARIAEQK
jgi:glutathione synthase/RimK-type ligase-like ATP-grasp enzyme